MDRRLQELQRRWAAGDIDAGARLLLERVRLRELSRKRLELAAYLDDPRARRALDGDAPTPHAHLSKLRRRLLTYGDPTAIRSAAAVALALTSTEHVRTVAARATRMNQVLLNTEPHLDSLYPVDHLHRAWMRLSWSTLYSRPGTSRVESILATAVDLGRRVVGKTETRAAIQRYLIPWALGESDPLGERIRERTGISSR